jgi:hypothetical protein
MAVNFAQWVYSPCFDLFARSVTIMPLASQPGQGPYAARGIFDTNEVNVEALDGSIFSDTRTELDIFEPEFPILPQQRDLVNIPFAEDVDGGDFEISDTNAGNAGGEITLTLRRLEPAKILMRIFNVSDYSLGHPSFATPTLTVI